ncbi:MAG: group III truncated hemoglobin [Rhodospirillales bacterium]|jgi:hemoglobin|uniref:Truncated hemoglobin-like protein n=2 Tax=Acidiphilium TaxID=522 RepID=A5FZL2_ACICJ|nr:MULTISPECIES: group III truncated hemoglobin [Acidiphilium]MBU6357203.1 group III truncated hemoglobin [Rhodospirillales bacterium]OYV67678.1 MAG: preprotein translocase subunit TatC [Acidiphilium sp. 21-66-27]OYW12678.1 MAG: preprotein translocase subunit TatC [Acidiphilium sp. 37-67-22]ABQ31044.1 Truncated hemoglobin-like protein [Acidiphilium cryptum JF-5]HQT72443.1 group III truncated hemoglobin [Acidiphilium sp.]
MQDNGIDEAMIERQVHAFYGAARRDPLIGPVFEAKVHDWDRHLGRMCAFWSSVALMSGRYSGTPMQAHAPLPIEAAHFGRWMELWAETAREHCPPDAADRFVLLAGRIARSLEHGIAVHRGELPLFPHANQETTHVRAD